MLVRDVLRAQAYFADKLGFTASRLWGDPPTFCIAGRDGLELMLNQVAANDSFRPNGDYDGRCDAYFWVRDADALHAEFKAKGADIVCEPDDQPYGMREILVRSPDGHLLIFGHDITGMA
ncbi:VOC family protein [Sphingomonas bacterium]|uniref:VOC family protein n=1 Tax=Sphingomonas bacterium TaxID=1895847 RepID=UPI0026129A99|nr:VOC family protein [Sphingomonas bacterium]